MKKTVIHLLLFIMMLPSIRPLNAGMMLEKDDEIHIEDINIKSFSLVGTTPTIDFDNFDVSPAGLVTLTGGINLSGGTSGAANTIDFGSGVDDDLTSTDVTDLTDAGETTLHSHGAVTALIAATLDDMYNNDIVGDAQITVDARDISFDLNDATSDFLISIDNTTTGAIALAFEIVTSGVGGTITTAIDLSG